MKEVGILWNMRHRSNESSSLWAINCGFGAAEIGTLAETEVNGGVIKRLRTRPKCSCVVALSDHPECACLARKRKECWGLLQTTYSFRIR